MREIIVGTRQSKLALMQTNWVIAQLQAAGVKNPFRIEKITTKGDRNLKVSLSKVGGTGIFIKDIEEALATKEIDFAVHSMKDVPATLSEAFVIAAIPVREDHRDVYIAKGHIKLKDLPKDAIIGTSSVRRAAQILAERPDVQTNWIRGAIDSRLEQLETGNYDAIILAAAGIKRLDFDEAIITEYLKVDKFLPAVGQGALAIECRAEDTELRDILAVINDDAVARAVTAERIFLELLEEGGQGPIGGYAHADADTITLSGTVTSIDGTKVLKETVVGKDPEAVAKAVVAKLNENGAKEIIAAVKGELDT